MTASALQQQREYIDALKEKNHKFGLTVGAAFVRGIRDIGYKHTGTALDEQIDNGYQANADQVHVVFGYEKSTSDSKPSELAVIDNGHGMEPDMIRASVTWGGTHRENDRSGFGRYGYGLPTSAISQGRRYTVYSKTEGGEVWAVTIDLDDIAAGKYVDEGGVIVVPEPRKAKLPNFVEEYIDEHVERGWTQGTIIVMENLDKLHRKTAQALHTFLMGHFGVTYHKLRDNFDIIVNGELVQPIDPLFTTPGCRYYDLDEQRAEALEPITIEVKDPATKEVKGQLQVRMSYMPPDFASKNKELAASRENANERFRILDDYNGFIFARNGRVMDVIGRNPITVLQNNDRYIKVEINFPAELDEQFNVSTSKQRVDVSDAIWDRLREGGLGKAIEHLRRKAKDKRAEMKERRERAKNRKRASEEAMENAGQVVEPKPSRDDEERRRKQGEEGLEREIARRVGETGQNEVAVRLNLELEVKNRGYKVAFDDAVGGPFFRVEQVGGAKVLFINRATRFFRELHSGPKSTPDTRAALELLMFSIGDRMLETNEMRREWYQYEIGEWSRKMEYAFAHLKRQADSAEDDDEEESAAA